MHQTNRSWMRYTIRPSNTVTLLHNLWAWTA